MDYKTEKKLELKRETLRNLGNKDLEMLNGGQVVGPDGKEVAPSVLPNVTNCVCVFPIGSEFTINPGCCV